MQNSLPLERFAGENSVASLNALNQMHSKQIIYRISLRVWIECNRTEQRFKQFSLEQWMMANRL